MEAYAIAGFKQNVTNVINDTSHEASFKDLAELLVLQPFIIAMLFEAAIRICDDTKSTMLKRPHSVHGIINVLGFAGVVRELENIQEAPLEKRAFVYQHAIDTYSLACVLYDMAKHNGHTNPQDFFLYGILSGVMKEESIKAFSGSKDLARYLSISDDTNIPSPEKAGAHIAEFEKGIYTAVTHELFRTWRCAFERIRNTLELIRQCGYNDSPIYARNSYQNAARLRR